MKDIFKNLESVWHKLKNDGKPVVLYGMGDGADKVIKAFEQYGIQPSAVMASDEFVRGQSFHGFTVKKLSDIEDEFDDFNIALCFASQLSEVMNTIKAVARKHTTLVPSVMCRMNLSNRRLCFLMRNLSQNTAVRLMMPTACLQMSSHAAFLKIRSNFTTQETSLCLMKLQPIRVKLLMKF